jgi:hypothetical protein
MQEDIELLDKVTTLRLLEKYVRILTVELTQMNRTKEFDLAQALLEVQLGVLHLLLTVQDHLVQTLAQEVVVLLRDRAQDLLVQIEGIN